MEFDEFENHNALAWSGRPGAGAPIPPKPRPALTFVNQPHADAEKMWRQRRPPVETVQIPADVALGSLAQIEGLALQQSCFVHCENFDNREALTFGIWGRLDAVRDTKSLLKKRLPGGANSKARSTNLFAKIQSLTPQAWIRHTKRWEKDVKRNRFRQMPPQDQSFQSIGTFHWPSKEWKAVEVLGPSLEAFDPIRMDCQCYIVHQPEASIIKVMGNTTHVQSALQRIRVACFQLAARSINPVRTYLVHWRTSKVPTHVYLEQHQSLRVIEPPSAGERPSAVAPRGDGVLDDAQAIKQAMTNSTMSVERVRATLANAIQKLHYYKGNMKLRVHLGTFLMSQYEMPKDEIYLLAEYEDMTEKPQFLGKVTEELVAGPQDRILKCFQDANHMLVPADSQTPDLCDVQPIYSAVFTFADKPGDVRLQMSWHVTNGDAVLFKTTWSRLERETGVATSLLDMNLTDLQTGLAWKFEITAAKDLENWEVPEPLVNFASSVRIHPTTESSEICKVTHSSFTMPKLVRQQAHWRYMSNVSDYTVEITRFQDRAYPPRQSITETVVPTVFEPATSVCLYRTEWDTWFASNERLQIGTSAPWSDAMKTWFPADDGMGTDADGDGFLQLIDKLVQIEGLVKGVL